MVYYGEWTQADDFEAVAPTTGFDAGFVVTGYTETVVTRPIAEGHYIPTIEEIRTAQIGANDTLGDGEIIVEPSGPMNATLRYTYSGIPFLTHVHTTLRAHMYFRPITVSPYTFGVHNWAPILLDIPEGAIGWQWQDDMSEGAAKRSAVVAAILSGEYTGAATFDQGLGGERGPLSGLVQTDVMFVPSASFTSDTPPASPTPAGYADLITDWYWPDAVDLVGMTTSDPPLLLPEVDLTGYLDEDGRVALGQKMFFSDSSPPLVFPDIEVGGEISYGFSPIPVITWTFRPPIFRWIFEGLPHQPPCRRYPGGATAANLARRYPPLPARQRSNRKSSPY